ncbi:MAG: glycosyltransferase family protein [bacterium]
MKKIWLYDDPRSYGARAILREAATGLREVGKDVRLYPYDPTQPNHIQLLKNDLETDQPDAILLANHPSSLFLRQIGFRSPPCQIFVWIFDDPFLMGNEPYSPEEIVLVADPRFSTAARQRKAQRILFLPVAAPVHPQAEVRTEYQHPVVYVGAAASVDAMRAQLPPFLADYLDRIICLKTENPAIEYDELLTRHPLMEGKKITLTGQVAYYLYVESNRRLRLEYLKRLVPFGLRLFGNAEWLNQIRGTPLQECFAGGIDPFREYPDLIRSATINLNLRSLQGYIVPTQRDFWVPAYGGFLLSSPHQKRIDDWGMYDKKDRFHLSRFPWSPVCAAAEEAGKAVDFWLNHPRQRQEWIQSASDIIQEHHTFAHRMEQLGEMLDGMI